jgi:DNA (cytosine-5)-methyltransferase 1
MSNEREEVDVQHFLRPCRVHWFNPTERRAIAAWTDLSPDHFWVSHHFPDLETRHWAEAKPLVAADVKLCKTCEVRHREGEDEFHAFLAELKPLRTFDPFAGCGAFGLGMEEVGCAYMTKAIEISPSAAQALK